MTKTEEGVRVRLDLSFRHSGKESPGISIARGPVQAVARQDGSGWWACCGEGPVLRATLLSTEYVWPWGGLHYFTLMTNLPAGYSRWGNRK